MCVSAVKSKRMDRNRGNLAFTSKGFKQRSGYWFGNRTPIPVAIGPAIGIVQACHSRGAKVTVTVVSTMLRLSVKHSIDLATVGRTMMEASLV